MNYIVVGCGRVGAELAYRLYNKGHAITVVDENEENFHNLHSDIRGRMIEGDAMNLDVLKRAGIETCDGLAVVTNSDTYNVVIAHLARTQFNIKNIIVRNYNPNWTALHDVFGFQSVSSSSWGAQRIEELLYNVNIRNVFSCGNGEVEIYEFTIPEKWNGKTLNELFTSDQCHPIAITRAGHAVHPDDEFILQADDIILVSATLQGIEKLSANISSNMEK